MYICSFIFPVASASLVVVLSSTGKQPVTASPRPLPAVTIPTSTYPSLACQHRPPPGIPRRNKGHFKSSLSPSPPAPTRPLLTSDKMGIGTATELPPSRLPLATRRLPLLPCPVAPPAPAYPQFYPPFIRPPLSLPAFRSGRPGFRLELPVFWSTLPGWRGSSGETKSLFPLPSTSCQFALVFRSWW